MYCETSSGSAGSTFIMDTSVMDTSLLTAFTLDFSLSRIGATIGTLNIYAGCGLGTFDTLIATYTGPDAGQSQGGVEWSAESVPFTPSTAGSVQFRFEYIRGTSFTGDLAIDDFQLL
jgi:hypothetical protein